MRKISIQRRLLSVIFALLMLFSVCSAEASAAPATEDELTKHLLVQAAAPQWAEWYAADTAPRLAVSVSRAQDSALTGDVYLTFRWKDVTNGSSVLLAEQRAVLSASPQTSVFDLAPEQLGTVYAVRQFACEVIARYGESQAVVLPGPGNFSVRVTPAGQVTVLPGVTEYTDGPLPMPAGSSFTPYMSYAQGFSNTPMPYVVLFGARTSNARYSWTQEGALLSAASGQRLVLAASDLGTTPRLLRYTCTVSASDASGRPLIVNNNASAIEVGVCDPANLVSVTGPASVRTGETIELTVDSGNLESAKGNIFVSGLEVLSVKGDLSNAAAFHTRRAENGSKAVYTCRVTAGVGQPASFTLNNVLITLGAVDRQLGAEPSWRCSAVSPIAASSVSVSALTRSLSWVVGSTQLPVLRIATTTLGTAPQTIRYIWTDSEGHVLDSTGPDLQLSANELGTALGARTFSCAVTAADANAAEVSVSGSPVTFTVNVTDSAPGTLPPLPTVPLPSPSYMPPIPTAAPGSSAPRPTVSATPSPTASPSVTGAPSEPSSPQSPDAEPSYVPSPAPTYVPTGDVIPGSVFELNEGAGIPDDLRVVPAANGEDSYLWGLSVSTGDAPVTAAALQSWIKAPDGGSVAVLSASGPGVPPETPLGTGMVLKTLTKSGVLVESTVLVIRGDVTGSGVMNLTQLVRMAAAYTGTTPLTGPYLAAGNLSGSGEITLTDLVREAELYRLAERNA